MSWSDKEQPDMRLAFQSQRICHFQIWMTRFFRTESTERSLFGVDLKTSKKEAIKLAKNAFWVDLEFNYVSM